MARGSIHSALGATRAVGGEQVILFIPDKDRDGQAIDQAYWIDEALFVLGSLFRGATAFPPGKGVWRNDARGGALLREVTVMVTSYVPAVELSRNLERLRAFLHRFGREARQGEVGIVISGSYHAMTVFDEA